MGLYVAGLLVRVQQEQHILGASRVPRAFPSADRRKQSAHEARQRAWPVPGRTILAANMPEDQAIHPLTAQPPR